MHAILELAPVPMLVTDLGGRFLGANVKWRELSLFHTNPCSLEAWNERLEADGRTRLIRAMEECARSGGEATLDLEIHGSSGARWSRWWIQRRMIEDVPVLVLVTLDVHEEVTQRDDLHERATRDDLTGLVNRRVFLETVEQALRRVERLGEHAGLLYIDLDSFKDVNDQAGHSVGDLVLTHVASRLREAVRSADVVGRIGGDEFAVVLEQPTSPGEAAAVARRIQESLNASLDAGGQTWCISASVGIALSEGRGESATTLIESADRDMYMAKRSRSPSAGSPSWPPAPAPPPS